MFDLEEFVVCLIFPGVVPLFQNEGTKASRGVLSEIFLKEVACLAARSTTSCSGSPMCPRIQTKVMSVRSINLLFGGS